MARMPSHLGRHRLLAPLLAPLLVTLLAAPLTAGDAATADERKRRDDPPVVGRIDTFRELPRIVYDAHRGGGMEARENSLSGLQSALDSGVVQVLDLDTRMLADGTIVLIHDATLERTTTSKGPVAELDLRRWRELWLDLGSWLRPAPPREHPITLAKALNRFGGEAVLSIEAKDPDSVGRIAQMIKDRGLRGSAYLNTNRPAVAREIDALGIRAHLWRSARQMATDDPRTFAPYTSLLDVDITAANADIDKFVRADVAPVWAHTITTRAERDRALRLGAVGIVTDNPRYVTGATDRYPRPPTVLALHRAPGSAQVSDPVDLRVEVRTESGPGVPDAHVTTKGRRLRARTVSTDRNAVSELVLSTARSQRGDDPFRLVVPAGSGDERRWTEGSLTVPLTLRGEDLELRPTVVSSGRRVDVDVKLLDSAAKGYAGPRRETGAARTVARLDGAGIRLVVLRQGKVVHRERADGRDTGAAGDGIGRVSFRWKAPRSGSYEVRVVQRGPVYGAVTETARVRLR